MEEICEELFSPSSQYYPGTAYTFGNCVHIFKTGPYLGHFHILGLCSGFQTVFPEVSLRLLGVGIGACLIEGALTPTPVRAITLKVCFIRWAIV